MFRTRNLGPKRPIIRLCYLYGSLMSYLPSTLQLSKEQYQPEMLSNMRGEVIYRLEWPDSFWCSICEISHFTLCCIFIKSDLLKNKNQPLFMRMLYFSLLINRTAWPSHMWVNSCSFLVSPPSAFPINFLLFLKLHPVFSSCQRKQNVEGGLSLFHRQTSFR